MKNPINFYFNSFRQYAIFDGRTSRQEFWWFWAIHILLIIVTLALSFPNPFISMLYAICALLPSIAVTVRRLHDTSHSGWWALPMITIIGAIIPFAFALQKGKAGTNQYGINPDPGASVRIF
jgi:uncharacterized membrane protein YhaH (DUF805 family)